MSSSSRVGSPAVSPFESAAAEGVSSRPGIEQIASKDVETLVAVAQTPAARAAADAALAQRYGLARRAYGIV
ncbi:MAG: hypothetical protein AAFX94_01540 [Myxococcota bacterium]